MSTLAFPAQDPLEVCGTPTPPGPVILPLDVQRAWSTGVVAGPEPLVVSVEGASGPLPWVPGVGLVTLFLMALLVWRRKARRTRHHETPMAVEEAPKVQEELEPDDVIPLSEAEERRRRRRQRKEKPKPKPIVVPLGGHRPKAAPVTVRLPNHAASILTRRQAGPTLVPDKPVVEVKPSPSEGDRPRREEQDTPAAKRSRSWWVHD